MYKTIFKLLLLPTTLLLAACSGESNLPEATATTTPHIKTPTDVPSATPVSRASPTSPMTPSSSPTAIPTPVTPVKTIIEEYDVSLFFSALRRTNLPDQWTDVSPVTLLAPTDNAFRSLDYGTYLCFRTDTAALADAMKRHVILGRYSYDDLLEADVLQTLDGSELTVKVEGDQILIDGAAILEADILSSFGYIHVIDRVLLPEE